MVRDMNDQVTYTDKMRLVPSAVFLRILPGGSLFPVLLTTISSRIRSAFKLLYNATSRSDQISQSGQATDGARSAYKGTVTEMGLGGTSG
jgi:hypothetical protein